jgi:hypothetical protein
MSGGIETDWDKGGACSAPLYSSGALWYTVCMKYAAYAYQTSVTFSRPVNRISSSCGVRRRKTPIKRQSKNNALSHRLPAVRRAGEPAVSATSFMSGLYTGIFRVFGLYEFHQQRFGETVVEGYPPFNGNKRERPARRHVSPRRLCTSGAASETI